MRDIIDGACTDWDGVTAGANVTYDCSNGVLSNSGTAYTSGTTGYHELNNSSGASPENVDTIWIYRMSSTINTAAGGDDPYTTTSDSSFSTLASTWEAKY
jgi:hypothetical protein